MSINVDDLAKMIESLSVKEASELVTVLKKSLNISDFAPSVGMLAGNSNLSNSDDVNAGADNAESAKVNLVFQSLKDPKKKIAAIKAIKEFLTKIEAAAASLADAKKIVESMPTEEFSDIDRTVYNEFKEKFQDATIEVQVKSAE